MVRILVIDKTGCLQSSHERHQAMASQPDIELHILGPHHWIENGRSVFWQPHGDAVYTAHIGRVFGKGYYARAGYYSGLCRALAASQPDLIQLLEEPWSISALQTWIASSLLAPKAKVVFYTWENIYRPWTYPSRASHLYRLIDRSLHNTSIAAVCATQQAKEVLEQKEFQKPIRVIPYGVPQHFFEEHGRTYDSTQPFTIGYIGRFIHMKGIDLLLQALDRLPDCRLLLAGAGEDEQEYRDFAQRLGIHARIEWHPVIEENRVPDFLRRMDLFVLPSRSTPGWQEQLGRAAIEAMAVGTPVIGSNSGAIPEVIGDAGLIFADGLVSDLVQKIVELRDDPDTCARLSKAGRNRAGRHYTWSNFATRICQFYRELLHA